MQEIIAVCKTFTIFHTADQGVLEPEVRQSVTGTELNVKSMFDKVCIIKKQIYNNFSL
jgi:hypothetical protein